MLTLVVLVLSAVTLTGFVPTSGLTVERAEEPETEPLDAVVAELSADVTQLEARYTADVTRLEQQLTAMQSVLDTCSRRSAFMAQFSAPKITTPTTGVLRFDQVIFNDGGNYDPTQGLYVAPFSGVYLFTVKVFTGEHESSRPSLDLVRNGGVVDRLAYDYLSTQPGHGGESHSLALSLHLQEGDTVGVQTVPGFDPDELYGGFHTSFSGALLYADGSSA